MEREDVKISVKRVFTADVRQMKCIQDLSNLCYMINLSSFYPIHYLSNPILIEMYDKIKMSNELNYAIIFCNFHFFTCFVTQYTWKFDATS